MRLTSAFVGELHATPVAGTSPLVAIEGWPQPARGSEIVEIGVDENQVLPRSTDLAVRSRGFQTLPAR
jgi:hypothetical protein